jgi:peptidoglycan/xylan/chitin deacetylase (PgdA/CDA1 family)
MRKPAALKATVRSVLGWVDSGLTSGYLRLHHDTPGLIILVFHPLFSDPNEFRTDVVHPLEGLTVRDFAVVVEHFLENEYCFVSPVDVLRGLQVDQRYVMVTFDDSYFRNEYALDILRKYAIPAVFFISTDHVLQNKPYWWDVIYRERSRLGISRRHIIGEIQGLKSLTDEQIDTYLDSTFGRTALHVVGDSDRPFTAAELAVFGQQPGVFLGNHTANHAILTNSSASDIRAQLLRAQEAITSISGQTPVTVAYPNGNFNDQTVRVASECGLRLGVTTQAHRNEVPVAAGSQSAMRLGRFAFRDGGDLSGQCRQIRSDMSLVRSLRSLRNRQRTREMGSGTYL